MILATVRMMIPRRSHDGVLKILRSVAGQSRIRLGCLSSRIYKDVEEDTAIVYEELWRSEEDLEYYLRSDEYSRLLLVMEMALQSPEVSFNTISRSSGIEMIEKARNPESRAER
jgi:quinol monooxygenase YgiN